MTRSALAGALALAPLLGAHPAAAEAPSLAACREARAALAAVSVDAPEAWTRYQEIVRALPEGAAPVVEHARQRAGATGDLSAALDVMRLALEDGCAPPARGAVDAEAARAEVAALLEDETRFYGARAQPDLLDQLAAALGQWLQALLESSAMQRYAETSRVVFLSLLGLVIAFVAWRLWRARERERRGAFVAAAELTVERQRVLAFAEWRREADARLAAGDLRGALVAGQMALLARLGEVDAGAVTPARTHREILARTGGPLHRVLEGPLSRFDRLFFGGHEAPAAVEAFLADVDAAAAALFGRRP